MHTTAERTNSKRSPEPLDSAPQGPAWGYLDLVLGAVPSFVEGKSYFGHGKFDQASWLNGIFPRRASRGETTGYEPFVHASR